MPSSLRLLALLVLSAWAMVAAPMFAQTVTSPRVQATEWFTVRDPGGRVDYNTTTGILAYDYYGGGDLYFDVWVSTLTTAGTCITCDHADLIAGSANKHIGQPGWNPAGTHIVFQAQNTDPDCEDATATPGAGLGNDLWVIDRFGIAATKVYTVATTGDCDGGLLHPHVSSSGTKVFFSERTLASPSTYRLAVCDIEFVGTPSVSGCVYAAPDALDSFYEAHDCFDSLCDQVLYSSIGNTGDDGFEDLNINKYVFSTTTRTALTVGQGNWNEHAKIGPDGRIVWMCNWARGTEVLKTDWGIMNADGSNKQRLTHYNDPRHAQYVAAGRSAADLAWVSHNLFIGFLQDYLGNAGRINLYKIDAQPPPTRWVNRGVRVNGGERTIPVVVFEEPPEGGEYGPSSDISIPVGAVVIEPGTTIQTIVNMNPPGTVYGLAAGTHVQQSVVPQAGDTFIGEYGAVMNGGATLTGWTLSAGDYYVGGQTQAGTVTGAPATFCDTGYERCVYPEELFRNGVIVTHEPVSLAACGAGEWFFDYAADRIYVCNDDPADDLIQTSITPHAFSGTAANVTIQNLIIEMYASPVETGAVYAQGNTWTVDNNEIRLNHNVGIKHASGTFTDNDVHHNSAFGFAGAGTGITVDHNEIAYNNTAHFNYYNGAGGSKWVFTENLTVSDNYSHHNVGPGLWTDISNNLTIYDGNTVQDNIAAGIFHELSYDAIIRNNIVSGNGMVVMPIPFWVSGAGILVTNAADVEIHDNIVTNNWQGIAVLDDNTRYSNDPDETHGDWGPVVNTNVHDNVVTTTCTTSGGGCRAGLFIQGQSTTTVFEPASNNVWSDNTYTLFTPTNAFVWANATHEPSDWFGYGHDRDGTYTTLTRLSAVEESSLAVIASLNTPAFHLGAGRLLIVAVRHDLGLTPVPNITDTAGNTFTLIGTAQAGAVDRIRLYYAYNTIANATNVVTMTMSGGSGMTQYVGLIAVQYDGAMTTSTPFDTFRATNGTSSATATTGTFTTTSATQLLVSAASWISQGTISATGNYEKVVQDADGFLGFTEDFVTSIQTNVTAAQTTTAAAAWEIIAATFKQAP